MYNGCQVVLCYLGLACALVGCANRHVHTSFSADMPASLALRGFRDAPLLEARIDGIGPVAVVLDTGSTACVIDPTLARQLGSPTRTSRRQLVNADGEVTEVAAEVDIGSLDLGVIGFEHVNAIVADLSPLTRAYGEPILAIVGYPLFAEVPLTIDFVRRQVSIEPARAGVARPVSIVDKQLPVVPAEVMGVPVQVLVDSASSSGWALPFEGIDFEPGSQRAKRVLMIDGDSTVVDGRLNGTASIGGLLFERPVVESTKGTPRIGARALESMRVTFDQSRGLVWLERVGPVHDETERGIGAELRPAGQTWEVWSVEPGLPAYEVGLRDGERVLTVDGFRVGEISLADLRQRMQREARVQLDVMRQGGIESVFVPIVWLER